MAHKSAKSLTRFTAGVAAIILICLQPFLPIQAQTLKVSDNNRYLVREDGSPFFWLGDTAWELFHRLNREEATRYLENRAAKGFTVIQAVVLAELDGLATPNPYGDLPLDDLDPTQPNESYFEHVDFIVDKAEQLGLHIGMLPTWGDKFNRKWGEGPEIFTPSSARDFGAFLGSRYKDDPIIWILGGDRNPETEQHHEIIHAMAEGIRQGDEGHHLMTYHPQGGSSSSQWFHDAEWLDFNMLQSGHAKVDNKNFRMMFSDYQKSPVKPALDGEPCYEDHPVSWDPEKGWFHAFDVRQAAYWSMLAGALGHTYGNHNIWQMWKPGREPVSSARTPWHEAMDYPGAFQMRHLRTLFTSRSFTQLIPDQELIAKDSLQNAAPARAASDRDSSFAIIYTPHGQSVDINLSMFGSSIIKASWYNPRMGNSIHLKPFKAQKIQSFDPPADPRRGNDWVLVIDREAAEYSPIR